MVSDVCLKNYVLLLFSGITIVFIYLKQQNDSNNLSFDLEVTNIENSRQNAMQYSLKLNEFKSLDSRNLININFQKICAKYNVTSFLERKHFLFSTKNDVLYCWIRKIASTSFTKIFSSIENKCVTNEFYREVEFLSPTTELLNSVNQNNNTFKFLIVRHPFERLVSSYRDRIEDNTKFTAQAWIYVSKIFYLTRPKLFHSNSTTGGTLEKIFFNDRRLKLVPTFQEFVTYLIQESSDNYDHHWNQYYKHCSLCEINYNFILKLDNNSPKEIEYISSKLNLPKETLINHQATTDFHRTCKYFKKLSCETILQLYEKYKIDFEMFDYKVENYLQCCNKKRKIHKNIVL
ncbi:carbohydrate sulfotransferase 11-like isoform X2 [Leptopilina heterotoma]|uniref:carbohydrate sulfotransferase 11-like isoform X2 n=1 Tax=Leptopilina heterotoma TaxID=63436 RepID=UPI001CA91B57|nr:carbohydrate sulfotransferase 11-like isoform X2 [Leptopilina heterotoma]